MKRRITIIAALASLALTLGLFSVTRSASAANDCYKIKGNLSGGGGVGAITQGGILNGTTQAVFTSTFVPTPDATTFSFTDDLTITTERGVLNTHNIAIFDVVRGVFTAIDRIDPNLSTGNFAGATGVLYVNGRTPDGGATIQAEIVGGVCLAN
ncbi:MAG: hypothetical protein ABIO91_08580 [Pyrinomonadaceae bacterium]